MKHELFTKPASFKEHWPRQYEIFSWIEFLTAIPQAISVITTWKEGHIPNACLQAWTTYTGDSSGYYVISSVMNTNHTYKNILREKDFVVNFPSNKEIAQCWKTIANNSDETDEITAVGLDVEPGVVVNAPRIKECFLNLECKLGWHRSLHEGSIWHIFSGEVFHVAIESNRTHSSEYGRYRENGYLYNIHSPTNPVSGQQDDSMIGIVELLRKIP